MAPSGPRCPPSCLGNWDGGGGALASQGAWPRGGRRRGPLHPAGLKHSALGYASRAARAPTPSPKAQPAPRWKFQSWNLRLVVIMLSPRSSVCRFDSQRQTAHFPASILDSVPLTTLWAGLATTSATFSLPSPPSILLSIPSILSRSAFQGHLP